MHRRAGAQHAGPCLSVWVVFLVLSSSCLALASRPYLGEDAQLRNAHQIRQLTQQVASSINSLSRQLKQSATCPQGCSSGFCQQDSTSGALRCAKCENNLIVSKLEGWCVCPAGKYSLDGAASCTDCPKGSWCAGGRYSTADPPKKVACPDGMTTVGLRATSSRSCVNMPGTFYSVTADGTPSATVCPLNTYGPGLKKQRSCVPCPTGFTTNGVTGARTATACVVPAGYFLKGPGQVAPCPRGEWKAGIGSEGNCTRCAMGVTTQGPAATSELNCTILAAGFYAKAMQGSVVTAVAMCPQKYYCPGGSPIAAFDPETPAWRPPTETTIVPCPDGLWTEGLGARVEAQCLVPPGYKASGGTVVPCADNEWRGNWKPAAEASTCNSCGAGVKLSKSDKITMYHPTSYEETLIDVATSSDDCYILAGQGLLYQSLNTSWRAVNCDSDNYGVANVSYGLSPQPCKPCPQNMVTSKDRATYPRSARWYHMNADGSGGFVSPYACVNKAGWGYNGRVSQRCDIGYYNDKDTYSNCRPCGFGLTTRAVGAGVRESDCGIAPGYGYEYGDFYNKTLIKCPIGKYADTIRYDRTSQCTLCPNGTTNTMEGGDSIADCDKCDAGWGGPKCATQCGGSGDAATYGPPGREYGSPCVPCNNVLTYYSFNWGTNNDVWAAPVVSRIGADNAVDCLAEYTQLNDGAYYLPVPDIPSNTVTNNVTTFSECVSLCTAGCALVTYDYKALKCYTLYLTPSTFEGDPFIAFKNVAAGSTGASSLKEGNNMGAASAGNSTVTGKVADDRGDASNYGWWRTPDALLVGIQPQPLAPGASTFDRYQQCLEACDYDRTCAGITVQQVLDGDTSDTGYNNEGPRSCRFVIANTFPGTNLRSMVKLQTENVIIPTWTKVCREMPGDVIHGKWPKSCAGTPTGGICQAVCDCNPDECYSRDGCPTTVCQADGNWGPFTPPQCFLAIPAQPQAISCPAPLLRDDIFLDYGKSCPPTAYPCTNLPAGSPCKAPGKCAGYSSGRRLLAEGGAAPDGFTLKTRRERALALRAPSRPGPARSLLWPVASGDEARFTPVYAGVGVICPDPWTFQNTESYYSDVWYNAFVAEGVPEDVAAEYAALYGAEDFAKRKNWPWTVDSKMLSAGFGQMVWDSGICDQYKTKWFTGISTQEFVRNDPWEKKKWELLPKSQYQAYAWGFFKVHDLPGGCSLVPDGVCDWTGQTSIQTAQLVVVGTVGTDHPCQAVCSVTAIELAIYKADDNTLEPIDDPDTGGPVHTATIDLSLDQTFNWSANATAVVYFDVVKDQAPKALPMGKNYWARFRLIVPFNGTDGSGLARCYAHIGLRDSQKNSSLPAARWQEAGGYNTTCGPTTLDQFPVDGQTVNSCSNGGAPNVTSLEACTLITSTNTCAQQKYGADTPRSCGFTGQDILFSFTGFSAWEYTEGVGGGDGQGSGGGGG